MATSYPINERKRAVIREALLLGLVALPDDMGTLLGLPMDKHCGLALRKCRDRSLCCGTLDLCIEIMGSADGGARFARVGIQCPGVRSPYLEYGQSLFEKIESLTEVANAA